MAEEEDYIKTGKTDFECKYLLLNSLIRLILEYYEAYDEKCGFYSSGLSPSTNAGTVL